VSGQRLADELACCSSLGRDPDSERGHRRAELLAQEACRVDGQVLLQKVESKRACQLTGRHQRSKCSYRSRSAFKPNEPASGRLDAAAPSRKRMKGHAPT